MSFLLIGPSAAAAGPHTFLNASTAVAPYTSSAGTGTSGFNWCPPAHGSQPPPQIPANSWASFLASEALSEQPSFFATLQANADTAVHTGWDEYLASTNGIAPPGFSSADAAADLLKSRLTDTLVSQQFWAGIAQHLLNVATPAGVDPMAFLGWMQDEGSGVENTCDDPHQLGQRLWRSSTAMFWQDGTQWAEVQLAPGVAVPPSNAVFEPVPNKPGSYLVLTQTTSYLPTVKVDGLVQLEPYGSPAIEPRSCDPLEPSTKTTDGQIADTAYQVTRDVASWIPGFVVPSFLPNCDTVQATFTPIAGPTIDFNGVQVGDDARYLTGWTYDVPVPGSTSAPAIARWTLAGNTYVDPVVVGSGLSLEMGFNGDPVLAMSDDGSTIAMCNAGPGGISADADRYGSALYPFVVHVDTGTYGWPQNGGISFNTCGQLSLNHDGSQLWWTQGQPAPGWWTASTLLPPDAPAPTVTVTGVSDGARYQAGSVPDAGCNVADALNQAATTTVQVSGTGADVEHGVGAFRAVCSYTDALNRTVISTAAYTVLDTVPPILTPLLDLTIEATGPNGGPASYMPPTAADAVDGAVPVTCTPSPGQFPLGITAVACSATDLSGNSAISRFTVNVRDTTPPAVTVPGSVMADADTPSGSTVTYTVSAVDLVDGPVPVSCTPASGSVFPPGDSTVSCQAADSHNNRASAAFILHVRSAAEQLTNLAATTAALPQGVSAAKDLTRAETALTKGDTAEARAQLSVYIRRIQQSAPATFTPTQQAALIDAARRILAAIG